jgi:hypothetical protein
MYTYLTLATRLLSPQHWGDLGGPSSTPRPAAAQSALGEEEEEQKPKNEPTFRAQLAHT